MRTKSTASIPSTASRRRRSIVFAVVLAVCGLLFIWRSLAATNPNLKGDLNGDNKVTITDLSMLLSNFNKTTTDADLDGNGKVTISDLSILLTNFGRTYTPANPTPTPTPTPPVPPSIPPQPPAMDLLMAAAGDIADSGEEKGTSDLIVNDTSIQLVLALGDNAYENGTSAEYKSKYDPTWGRFKSKTRATPGNHEYQTSGASGYYGYYYPGVASPPQYYSFDQGAWHFISLNSQIDHGSNSTQVKWLVDDLAAHPTQCTLAFWHQPRFTAGSHDDDSTVQIFWDKLYAANADVVLNGHSHTYERFAPSKPDGTVDAAKGIREFVVGTGGGVLGGGGHTVGTREFADESHFGVIKMTLSSTGYTWKFVNSHGGAVLDQGSGTCH